MTAKFFAILTQQGAAKLANATALGTQLDLTQLAVGDGGGTLPTPDPAQTKLKGEKRRAAINMLSVDPANANQIIAEQVIPENEGGWWIREIGLLDKDGTLIAVANCPETYKPQLQEGSGRTQTIRMVLIVSSTEAVTLKIDPAVVLATRDYVDRAITVHAQSRNHPDASTTAKGFVQLSSATNSTSEVLAATPKAVKAAYDIATDALSKTVTTSQSVASTVIFKSGAYAYGEVMVQALTGKPNAVFRFRDEAGADKGAIYAQTDTGQLNLRWSGTSYTAQFKPDGTIAFPSTIFSGNAKVLTSAMSLGTTDLNTLFVEQNYFQIYNANATPANNYPVANAGTLVVLPPNAGVGNRVYVTQKYYPYTANKNFYMRYYDASTSTWSPWEVFDSRTASDARYVQMGAYGLGQVGMSLSAKTTGFIAQAAQTGLAPGNGAGFQSAYASNRRAQLYISTDGTVTSRFSLADTPDTDTTPWNKHYTTANVIADANGFLKSASASTSAALIRSDFPVGIPQPWPTNTAPAGWLKCNGAAFDKAKYPLLAAAYPAGTLPDLRGEFIRGWDEGRGVDTGRTLLSAQTDAVQKFTGKTNGIQHFVPGLTPQGIIAQGETVAATTGLTETSGSTGNGVFRINIDASLQIRTATETRPRNIAFNYIVRAA
ncbi:MULTISPECIES: phage tail protein [unclassified Serratia (in: enterobacteria)]|uniref:phage tail-collar fiber domain-containing protein n=1 Tax=unclassified Serratia (in: enterobacteria) TaxID=2647522 RepID=UPI0009DDB627|nr:MULTISPECIES: phage tail protein [unclassified Serratia (in: enterobacteria)]